MVTWMPAVLVTPVVRPREVALHVAMAFLAWRQSFAMTGSRMLAEPATSIAAARVAGLPVVMVSSAVNSRCATTTTQPRVTAVTPTAQGQIRFAVTVS